MLVKVVLVGKISWVFLFPILDYLVTQVHLCELINACLCISVQVSILGNQ